MTAAMKKAFWVKQDVPEMIKDHARLTLSLDAVIFSDVGARSPSGDRQALNPSKRRASAIVTKSGAFFVSALYDGVDVDAFEHAGFPFCPGSWRTTFTPSPLDRQASDDGFLKQKEAAMPRLFLRSRFLFKGGGE